MRPTWAAPVHPESDSGAPGADRRGNRSGFVYGAVLGVALLGGYALGRHDDSDRRRPPQPTGTDYVQYIAGTVGPPGTGPPGIGPPGIGPQDGSGAGSHLHAPYGSSSAVAAAVGGLGLTDSGLTLASRTTTFRAGRRQPFTFRITAPGGASVTTFTPVHDKLLHLVVIRRDLTGYRHVHPAMAPDGSWSIGLTLDAPGSYRAIADFTAIRGGRQTPVVLGIDLTVAGDYEPVALPAPATEANSDGFTVRYAGTLRTDPTGPLLVTVTGPGGEPAALEPYLGALGHLVVIREGDVGYVHVHPEPQPVGGAVAFRLAAPGPGRYRMFLDFQVAGRVHTAALTVAVR